jgi:hypothetical protein
MLALQIKEIHRLPKGIFVEFSPTCTLNRIINCYTLEELNRLIQELDILTSCDDTEPVIGEFSFIDFTYGANKPKVYLSLYDPSDLWRASVFKIETICYSYTDSEDARIEHNFDTISTIKALKEWHKILNLEVKVYSKISPKISTLHDLSTRRPLLAREKFELAILEKLQKADNLEQLEKLQTEVENEATDAQLKTQLLIIIEEKKGFY